MSISKNDPFNINLCIRGLGNQLTYMHSDLYEYNYYLTFKRSFRAYKKEFNDAWDNVIEHAAFFENSTDPYVRIGLKAEERLMVCKLELCLRWGIIEEEDLQDELISEQADRFNPFTLYYKKSKSYRKLNLYFVRTLTGFIECLYQYACVLTAQSYKVPLLLKKQFSLPDVDSLRLLNEDDNTVILLTELITELKQDLAEYKLLIENKGKPVKAPKVKDVKVPL